MRPSTSKAAITTLTSSFREQITGLSKSFCAYEEPQVVLVRMELLWRMFNIKQVVGTQIKEEE